MSHREANKLKNFDEARKTFEDKLQQTKQEGIYLSGLVGGVELLKFWDNTNVCSDLLDRLLVDMWQHMNLPAHRPNVQLMSPFYTNHYYEGHEAVLNVLQQWYTEGRFPEVNPSEYS